VNAHILLRASLEAEFLTAHAGQTKVSWVYNLDPLETGSYLTTCVNRDGAKYLAVHYWDKEWHSPGPFVAVRCWARVPELG
jgi:hypothetical protein